MLRHRFDVEEENCMKTDVLSPELSLKYPEIHAYRASDFHHPANTVRINYNAHLKKFNSEILFQGQRFYLVRQETQQGAFYYYLYNIRDFIQTKQPFEKGE